MNIADDDLPPSSSSSIGHWTVQSSIGLCPGKAFLACSRCGPTSSSNSTPYSSPGVPCETPLLLALRERFLFQFAIIICFSILSKEVLLDQY